MWATKSKNSFSSVGLIVNLKYWCVRARVCVCVFFFLFWIAIKFYLKTPYIFDESVDLRLGKWQEEKAPLPIVFWAEVGV